MSRTVLNFPLLGLMALMIATRFHHFGDMKTLPDASLAVFFLAGLWVARAWFFLALLALAGLMDYLAISFGGVSGWCVTPAYLFLIPTYGAMWLGGYFCRRFSPSWHGLAATLAVCAGAALAAFVISNASFYWLSGYFNELPLAEFIHRVSQYLPAYLSMTLAYTALILGGHWLWKQATMEKQALNPNH